jgi:activator of 2-hydroxyglutaryl-CoA dehydratase
MGTHRTIGLGLEGEENVQRFKMGIDIGGTFTDIVLLEESLPEERKRVRSPRRWAGER